MYWRSLWGSRPHSDAVPAVDYHLRLVKDRIKQERKKHISCTLGDAQAFIEYPVGHCGQIHLGPGKDISRGVFFSCCFRGAVGPEYQNGHLGTVAKVKQALPILWQGLLQVGGRGHPSNCVSHELPRALGGDTLGHHCFCPNKEKLSSA